VQNLIFSICMGSALIAFDAIHFDGRYRVEVWQDLQRKSETVTRAVEYGGRQLWRNFSRN
jgi:hypothetical protein